MLPGHTYRVGSNEAALAAGGHHIGPLTAFAAVRLRCQGGAAAEEPSWLEPIADGKAALPRAQLQQSWMPSYWPDLSFWSGRVVLVAVVQHHRWDLMSMLMV